MIFGKWTLEEDEWLKENYKTKTTKELEKIIGRTPNAISQRRHILGLTHPSRKHQYNKCLNCQKIILNYNTHFCSNECMIHFNQMSKRLKKWKRLIRRIHYCLFCHKRITRPKFCSHKCCYSFQQHRRRRRKVNLKLICKQCGDEFTISNYGYQKKFCSSKCWGIYMSNEAKKQGNWNFTSRVFAKAIINLREINREVYLQMHNSLTKKQKKNFDRVISKFYTKFYGKSFRDKTHPPNFQTNPKYGDQKK